MNISKINKIIYWSILVAFLGCYAFIYFAFPFGYDDWFFQNEIMHLGIDDNGHHTLGIGVKETIKSHYLNDNSRIGNTLAIIFHFFFNWIPSLIIVIAFSFGFLLMLKLLKIRPGQYVKLIFLIFLTIFCMPWEEYMFSTMFAFNYIVYFPLLIGFVYVLINKVKINPFITAILGFLIGAWHESLALAAFCSSSAVLLLKPLLRTKTNLLMVGFILTGVLWLTLFPGMWVRKSHELDATIYSEMKMLIYTFPWVFVCISFIVGAYVHRLREICKNEIVIMTIVAGIILIPVLIILNYVRSILPLYYFSICSIFLIVNLVVNKFNLNRKIIYVAVLFLGIFYFAHLIAVCRETVTLRNLVECQLNAIAQNKRDGNTYFIPVRFSWQTSKLTFTRPDKSLGKGLSFIFYRLHMSSFNHLLPEDLLKYKSEDAKFLKGNTNYKIWEGYIISENLNDTIEEFVDIGYKYFNERNLIYKNKFRTNDNKEYIYIDPLRSKKSLFFGEPESITRDE